MNTQELSKLDVKLTLASDNQSTIKRIHPFQTVKEILDVARQIATKEGVNKKSPLTISYNDADNEIIRVEDDSDLQMAYCIALSSDKKIKFIINYPQAAPKINIQPVEVIPAPLVVIQAPVVVEEVKQESKPEPPKMVPQVMIQQP